LNRKSFLKSVSISPFLMNISHLNGLGNWASSLPNSEPMPLLFLGHGSPMNAIEDNQFVRGFKEITKTLPTPKAIICISAHWYTKGIQIMASPIPKTIYDFGGFPEELYQVKYPVKGDVNLAKEVQSILKPTTSNLSEDWGLDHGAWSVLIHLFPEANIPVIQLSIDYTMSASEHYELAKSLKSFRDKGILIIGSGNIVHNLGLVDWPNMHKDNHGFDWAIEAREKINQAILENNMEPLLNYNKQGKAFQNAIPTPDHYLPLIYALALQNKEDKKMFFNDKLVAGSLSMTSLKIG
jgi:4,5-DOPA dioxygenase extradiol